MVAQTLHRVSRALPAEGFLGQLDPAARRQLMIVGRPVTLPVGAYLTVQGSPNNTLFVILSGKLRVSCHAHGNVVQLAIFEAGDIVGEMSVLDSHLASADVVVIEQPARLWTITGDDFNALVQSDPTLGLTIMRALSRELSRLLRRNSENMLRREDAVRACFLDADY